MLDIAFMKIKRLNLLLGLDAVVTQLLGQLENSGPPPLPRDQLAALPQEILTEDHAAKGTACSVCWENFETG